MKRFALVLALLFLCSSAFATTYTISDAGGNWNSASTWTAGVGFPIAGDAVVATATSGALTVNVASACSSVDFTGYTGIFTINANLTVSGNFKLVAGMTVAADLPTRVLLIDAVSTLTSGGLTWPCALSIAVSDNITWADNWTFTGVFKVNGATAAGSVTFVTASRTLTCNGGVDRSGSSNGALIAASHTIIISGGTWAGETGVGLIAATAITISGNVTITGSVGIRGSTLSASGAGTINASLATLRFAPSSTAGITLNVSPLTWAAVIDQNTTNNRTVTLSSDLNVSGTFTFSNTTATQTYNGSSKVSCSGLSLAALTTGTIAGTSRFVLTGGTLSMNASSTTGVIKSGITFQGDVIVSGRIAHQDSSITYVSGSIVTTGSRLVVFGNQRLNTSGMSWNDVTFKNTSIDTLTSQFVATGICSLQAATTFRGAGGFAVDSLVADVAGVNHILQAGAFYNVSGYLKMDGALGSTIGLSSSSASSYAYFRMGRNISQAVDYVVATDINSAYGRGIYDANGTLTRTVNWSVDGIPPLRVSGTSTGSISFGRPSINWGRGSWGR